MLIPRFTLRAGLIGLTFAALLAIVMREALLGRPWAIGGVGGLASIVLMFLLHAVLFGLTWLLSRGSQPSEPSDLKGEQA